MYSNCIAWKLKEECLPCTSQVANSDMMLGRPCLWRQTRNFKASNRSCSKITIQLARCLLRRLSISLLKILNWTGHRWNVQATIGILWCLNLFIQKNKGESNSTRIPDACNTEWWTGQLLLKFQILSCRERSPNKRTVFMCASTIKAWIVSPLIKAPKAKLDEQPKWPWSPDLEIFFNNRFFY